MTKVLKIMFELLPCSAGIPFLPSSRFNYDQSGQKLFSHQLFVLNFSSRSRRKTQSRRNQTLDFNLMPESPSLMSFSATIEIQQGNLKLVAVNVFRLLN